MQRRERVSGTERVEDKVRESRKEDQRDLKGERRDREGDNK